MDLKASLRKTLIFIPPSSCHGKYDRWFRNPANHQLICFLFHCLRRVFCIPGGARRISEPSTVSALFRQQFLRDSVSISTKTAGLLPFEDAASVPSVLVKSDWNCSSTKSQAPTKCSDWTCCHMQDVFFRWDAVSPLKKKTETTSHQKPSMIVTMFGPGGSQPNPNPSFW